MHAEIFERKYKWYWHFKNGGRIVADAESFPSKSNALRAAKSVVRGVLRRPQLSVWWVDAMGVAHARYPVTFTTKLRKDGVTILKWD